MQSSEQPAYADFLARLRLERKEWVVDGRLADFWLHHTPQCRVAGSKSVPDVFPSPNNSAAASKNVPDCLPSPHTYHAIGLESVQPCRIPTSQRRDPVSLDIPGLATCNFLVDVRCVLHVTSARATSNQNNHGGAR